MIGKECKNITDEIEISSGAEFKVKVNIEISIQADPDLEQRNFGKFLMLNSSLMSFEGTLKKFNEGIKDDFIGHHDLCVVTKIDQDL